MAYEYAKRGARLALVGRRENALREVVDRASDFGSPDVLMIHADVSKVEDCKRIVDDTMNHYGRRKYNLYVYKSTFIMFLAWENMNLN